MVILIFIVIALLLIPFFFSRYYITELMMSFLPYLIGIVLVFSVIAFLQLKKKLKPGYPYAIHRYFRGFAFLVFCGMFFIRSKQFNHFYTPLTVENIYTGNQLTIFYTNIHKDNIQYKEIQHIIEDNDPDVLMFVEFADHHYDNLKDLLEKNYPYTNTTSRSKTFIGSMVFSKYPINNKADDFPQGSWRYGYFSLTYQEQELYLYLVHTSSPDSYEHFLMRNEQLTTFVDDFQKHESDRIHKNIAVVGDFNITPWSSYYTILDESFSGYLENDTKTIPFLFTWKYKIFPLAQAHIDHIRSTDSVQIDTIDTLTIPGSDHKGFLFTIKMD